MISVVEIRRKAQAAVRLAVLILGDEASETLVEKSAKDLMNNFPIETLNKMIEEQNNENQA